MGLFGLGTKYNGKEVDAVKMVGVRTAEQTKIMATYNFGIYSFLVRYKDGTVEMAEEKYNSQGMKVLMQYIVF